MYKYFMLETSHDIHRSIRRKLPRQAIVALMCAGALTACGSASDPTEPVDMGVIGAPGHFDARGNVVRCLYNRTREGVLDQAVQSEILTCDFAGDSLFAQPLVTDADAEIELIQIDGINNAKGTVLRCLRVYSESGILDQSVRSEGLSCDFAGLMTTP